MEIVEEKEERKVVTEEEFQKSKSKLQNILNDLEKSKSTIHQKLSAIRRGDNLEEKKIIRDYER